MNNKYIDEQKIKSLEAFRGIDVLYVYFIVILSVGVGFLHIIFNNISIFKYFPITSIITYILNLLLCFLIVYIRYNTMIGYVKELEKNFNILKQILIYILQFLTLYLMPVTSLLHGVALWTIKEFTMWVSS